MDEDDDECCSDDDCDDDVGGDLTEEAGERIEPGGVFTEETFDFVTVEVLVPVVLLLFEVGFEAPVRVPDDVVDVDTDEGGGVVEGFGVVGGLVECLHFDEQNGRPSL